MASGPTWGLSRLVAFLVHRLETAKKPLKNVSYSQGKRERDEIRGRMDAGDDGDTLQRTVTRKIPPSFRIGLRV